jgi:23S rRNA (adenine2030-N6)-methyltransferase
LRGPLPQKNREYLGGAQRFWQCHKPPASLREFHQLLTDMNPKDKLEKYPGSPYLLKQFLRPADRLILSDLHSTEAQILQEEFSSAMGVSVRQEDGYQLMKALLPPKERRGLIFCDPAYELANERARLVEAIIEAWKRWPTGLYAIWYPILDTATVDWLHRQFKRSGINKILVAELRILAPDEPDRLNGSGMLMINPPWKMEESLNELGPWLWKILSNANQGGFRQHWLVGE